MAVVATGFFDGVHLGHRRVIDTLVSFARSRGEASVVVTFWPHPRTVLQNGARELRLLTSLQEKKDILLSLGVDRIEVLDFSREFSRLTAEEYLRSVVKERLGGTAVVAGYDNRLGADQCGPDGIASLAASLGLECLTVERFGAEDAKISSTSIRTALAEGRVDDAARMLGRPYSLHGVVVAGNRLGRTIGFPTANMQLYEPLKLLPGNGVYCVGVETLGCHFRGMCNIGLRPTVSSASVRTIETHIFDFDEQIYGLDIRISFLRKIRDERRFGSLEELKARLEKDRLDCQQLQEELP